MKKLFLFVLPFLSALLNAEELRFVTVLSSPVGTFNRLEEVDPTVPVKSPVINFCTKLGNSGTVTLQGNKNPEVNTLSLSNGTILGGSGKDYVLNKLTMKQGGTLKGSRLLANVMQVPNGGMGKSENLYSNNLTVAGAKAGKLYVNGSDAVIEEAWPADVTMVWSNEYQTDNACGTDCKKQYLLKQKGNPSVGCDQRLWDACETDKIIENMPGTWNEETCSCICPEGFVVNAQGYCDCPNGEKFIATVNNEYFGQCGTCNHSTRDQHIDYSIQLCEGASLSGGQLDQEGYGDYWYQESGTWNETTCSCDCPKNTSRGKKNGVVYCYIRESTQDPCGSVGGPGC